VNSLFASLGVFVAIMIAALAGLLVRAVLPAEHTSEASKDVIKIGMGLVVTLSAMVLGLLVASAKSSYNTKVEQIDESAARVIMLGQNLRVYGDETKPIREMLRTILASKVALKWLESADDRGQGGAAADRNIDDAERMIGALAPTTDVQRIAKADALQILSNLANTRWLLVTQKGSSIPLPFLIVLVFWFVAIFGSLSLLAPPQRDRIRGHRRLCIVGLERDIPDHGARFAIRRKPADFRRPVAERDHSAERLSSIKRTQTRAVCAGVFMSAAGR